MSDLEAAKRLFLEALGFLDAQDYGSAEARLRDALIHAPRSVSILANLAVAVAQQGRPDEALAFAEQAIEVAPDNIEALLVASNCYVQSKQHGAALAACDKIIAVEPRLAEIHSNRAIALKGLHRYAESLESCDRAIALQPRLVGAHNNRANALAHLGRHDEALRACDDALRLDPDVAEALVARGNIHVQLGRYDAAFANFDAAFRKNPALNYLEGDRLHAKMHVCNWQDFDRDWAHLLASINASRAASAPFPLLAVPSTPQDQRRCAELYAADSAAELGAPLWRGERYAHQRIRVAYLSPDFREHPLAYLTAGLYDLHDRSRFEIIAISFGPPDDSAMRRRLTGSFDQFVDVDSRSDREVAELLGRMDIDIAVDLCGYTRHSRPNILGHRPAPVQASYLGYAGTMGAGHIDYLIADRALVPRDHRAAYSEAIVYLPDSFMANDSGRRISARVPARAEQGLPDRGFVFCCFNNTYKITPDVFDLWMRLLAGTDGSVLWLSGAHTTTVQNLRAAAADRGVASERLVFAAKVPLNEDHLARVGLADLFLDTLHYNAHATAADALWAGVPVVTCPGATFASRVAGSLLGAVGLPELIVGSRSDYEALALRLAHDPQRLGGLRERLARNRATFPLFDTARFTRHLEAAYLAMWERAQRGEAPADMSIAAIA